MSSSQAPPSPRGTTPTGEPYSKRLRPAVFRKHMIGASIRTVADLLVRAASELDVDRVVDLLAQLHPAYPGNRRGSPSVFSQIRQQQGRTLIVAADGDEIVGTADLLIVPNLSHGGRPWAIVENIVVDREARGRGIGGALLADVIRRCDENGCYMLQLVSLKHRRRAHDFYRQLQLQAVGEGFRRYSAGFAPTTSE